MPRVTPARTLGSLGSFLCLLLGISRAFGDSLPGEVGLVLFGDELPREELRAALAKDLGRAVTLLPNAVPTVPCVTVTWKRAQSELAVTYDEPGRGTLARVILTLPSSSTTV